MKTQFLVTSNFDKSYKKLKKKYASIKNDIEQFKKDFSENRELGINLGGGYRKVRISIQSKNKGKSGGARIITYELCFKTTPDTIVLVDIYDKSEKDFMPDWEYTAVLQDFIRNLK